MINWIKIQFESWIEYKRALRERKLTCNSCEVLKLELSRSNERERILLDKLTEHPDVPVDRPAPEITPRKFIPMSVKRQQLEREDRVLADQLRKRKTDELEKEVIQGTVSVTQSSRTMASGSVIGN